VFSLKKMPKVAMLGRPRGLAALVLALTASCAPSRQIDPAVPIDTSFSNPQRVTIEGYDSDAMEPFLSRDGRYLFFNNLNDPSVNTNLYWAERIDDLHFKFRGEVEGANTPALEAVASLDRQGNFYFVSNRSYDHTASTLYRGKFANGSVSSVELVPGVSRAQPGIVNFDAEISADGNTLYFVESQFNAHAQPQWAKILFARRTGDKFVRDQQSATIMSQVNGGVLNYAPATTESQCEIFFTRANATGPAIYEASRTARDQPFQNVRRIDAITGFAEAPTVSPDGRALYFHKKENDRFVLYRVTRPASALPAEIAATGCRD
jgi:Tol biopolymer transport system component